MDQIVLIEEEKSSDYIATQVVVVGSIILLILFAFGLGFVFTRTIIEAFHWLREKIRNYGKPQTHGYEPI